MRWTEADQCVRNSRDVRFATLYPAQTLESLIAASVNLVVIARKQTQRTFSRIYRNRLFDDAFSRLFRTVQRSEIESKLTIRKPTVARADQRS